MLKWVVRIAVTIFFVFKVIPFVFVTVVDAIHEEGDKAARAEYQRLSAKLHYSVVMRDTVRVAMKPCRMAQESISSDDSKLTRAIDIAKAAAICKGSRIAMERISPNSGDDYYVGALKVLDWYGDISAKIAGELGIQSATDQDNQKYIGEKISEIGHSVKIIEMISASLKVLVADERAQFVILDMRYGS